MLIGSPLLVPQILYDYISQQKIIVILLELRAIYALKKDSLTKDIIYAVTSDELISISIVTHLGH